MNPIVEKVFATEESARKKIQEARDKAQAITSEAAKEADAIIAKAKEESLESSRTKLEAAKAVENARLESEKSRLREEAEGLDISGDEAVKKAAEQIADILLSTSEREA